MGDLKELCKIEKKSLERILVIFDLGYKIDSLVYLLYGISAFVFMLHKAKFVEEHFSESELNKATGFLYYLLQGYSPSL